MPKVIFILHRKDGTTRQQCLERWAGDRHTSIVGRIPGLTRWVQNYAQSAPGEPAACDGVGELWFESNDAMQRALSSPEMSAAVEDAENFLDMEKTGLVVVEERTILESVAS
jgi:uncharacterized protein (TIGR02118 family)